jgi:hypothetical protein
MEKFQGNRKTTARLTLRFLPEEMDEFEEAIRLSSSAWKGKSYHAHGAILDWARSMIASSKPKRRTPASLAELRHYQQDQVHTRKQAGKSRRAS